MQTIDLATLGAVRGGQNAPAAPSGNTPASAPKTESWRELIVRKAMCLTPLGCVTPAY